jgi:hypothetical protein
MPARRSSSGWALEQRAPSHKGLVIAGAVVVGLGVLGWIYFGPELRRYLTIRNM